MAPLGEGGQQKVLKLSRIVENELRNDFSTSEMCRAFEIRMKIHCATDAHAPHVNSTKETMVMMGSTSF